MVSPVRVWRLTANKQGEEKESRGLLISQESTCLLALSLVASRACGRWARNNHSYPLLRPFFRPRAGAKVCQFARLCSPEGQLFCPRLGPAHITHPRLGTQEGVRALGDLRAPIKPSQSSHKELVIFDDLKGLVPEWECEQEGGGETLKKTKRTVIRCPRRWKWEGGCVCTVCHPAGPHPLLQHL